MDYIEMHAHMVSRTTDDYTQMALMGCAAITEPAFWAGWDRSTADGFDDYFRQLTEFEPKRAARFGIKHYTWLCLNPKEGEERDLARAVVRRIPKYLDHANVLGIGEIGLNRVTRNEIETFKDHVALALEHNQMILIHTPHLEDKHKGTRAIIQALQSFPNMDPARVSIDHAEEHTIEMILDNGFWTGLTLYPQTKVSVARAVDIIEMHGADRVYVDSACDWGHSVPAAVPRFVMEMRRRGHADSLARQIVWDNPIAFLGQCPKFEPPVSAHAV
ncbi:MAG: TatD family hydrolase [Armatimonadetes bacterium]|nr:TatD family hydrolase [Armatimonadota bacterium]